MQKELFTWSLVLESINKQMPVTVLYVTESRGSSPGRQGFLMVINEAGEIRGSLGGGIMEHKFIELAKSRQKERDLTASLHRQIHNKAALQNQSGMICSGEQTILIYPLKQTDSDAIRRLINSLQQAKNGTLTLSLTAINFFEAIPAINFQLSGRGQDFLLTLKTGYKHRLFIIGAGHCSLAFARLMNTMDFYISLYENRLALHTLEQNYYVHEKILTGDYNEIEKLISGGEDNYVVIMTNGYRDDEKALRALISKNFAYLGLLGSKKKIENMFAGLISDGISTELISRVYAPAGIPVKSQTPEEIAVSIAAEIIKVKNSKL